MSDLAGPQPEEPARRAGASTDAAPGPGPGEAAPTPTSPISPDAATGWAVLVFVIAQALTAAIVLTWYGGEVPASSSSKTYDGTLVALVTLVTNPALIGLFWAVVRFRGLDPIEYLGLTRFSLRHFLEGFLALAALALTIDVVSYLAQIDIVPTFQIDTYTSARRDGWLAPLLLAVVLVAPAGEEIMYRGFLFRGWVRPGFRVTAIIMITALWSGQHIQYEWFGISQVFVTGLVLGWLRWRSGSTLLTMVLHMLVNLGSTIETMIKVGWMPW